MCYHVVLSKTVFTNIQPLYTASKMLQNKSFQGFKWGLQYKLIVWNHFLFIFYKLHFTGRWNQSGYQIHNLLEQTILKFSIKGLFWGLHSLVSTLRKNTIHWNLEVPSIVGNFFYLVSLLIFIISQCSKMFPNASYCFIMSNNVPRCFLMFHSVS